MNSNRRQFIRKGAVIASAAALPVLNLDKNSRGADKRAPSAIGLAKDAGIQFSLAYFWGIEPEKVALAKQMAVFGAVGGISPGMVQMRGENNYDLKVIKAVKEAWEKEGLNL